MRPLLALLVLVACGGERDTAEFCADVVPSTWESFGQDFFQENCQSCHSEATENRFGAPPSVNFDTEAQVRERGDRVLDRVEEGSMPPQGGIGPDDVERLDRWLTCGT